MNWFCVKKSNNMDTHKSLNEKRGLSTYVKCVERPLSNLYKDGMENKSDIIVLYNRM